MQRRQLNDFRLSKTHAAKTMTSIEFREDENNNIIITYTPLRPWCCKDQRPPFVFPPFPILHQPEI